jgi:cardiolipin-specific phospholipase
MNLSQLVLLSPVGVPHAPENRSVEARAQRAGSMAGAFLVRRLAQLWAWHMSPFTVLRKSGYWGANWLLMRYATGRLRLRDRQEAEACKEFLLQTNMRQLSSESSITMILAFGAFAKIPLVDLLETVAAPICFLYGESDWMSRTAPDELIQQGKLKEGSVVRTIENAGH